ncbi:unnamed protein product [Arabidopsis lyrata]|uniref:Predicted protein n=1 Tax=Arabidopsis lyrata subsp. lyrata TaxID=81972 RepID=D7LCY4_ARALL|nr:predicted protein [Arabidopsis lyrata subsp. lyrata]CAH8264327.1 unnamed protein product [Arabidopsis lyrata]
MISVSLHLRLFILSASPLSRSGRNQRFVLSDFDFSATGESLSDSFSFPRFWYDLFVKQFLVQ